MLATTLNLAARVKRPSRRPIVLPNIAPTQAQADDLARIYLSMLAAWQKAIPMIVAEYERSIGELTTDSAATTGGQVDSVAAEINRLVILLTPDLRRWAVQVERVLTGKWVRGVLSATDIDLSTVLSPGDMADTVDASIEWNVALIRDVSDELRRRIANSVFAGFQRRAPAAEIAREIREATGMARARALRIAGDQTVKLGSRLNQARQEQAGLDKYRWRHSGKLHFRPAHKARDGKIYPWRGPGSIRPGDQPGHEPFCGCTAQGIITFGEE